MAWPGISTKNTEKKKKNRPEILDSQNLSPKYPENTEKIPPKIPKNAHLGYFFGILGVFSWGSRLSGRGVFFRYFSWKFRLGPSRGSVAGRGVFLKLKRRLEEGQGEEILEKKLGFGELCLVDSLCLPSLGRAIHGPIPV